jgi:glycosyltransferase involved in cell wall biosynthesis
MQQKPQRIYQHGNIMATAVLDLDFENLPAEITGLNSYTCALVLIRIGGRPVGQALLPVVNGRVGGDEELQDALLYAADSGFWEQWLQHYLGMKDPMPAKISLPKATVAVCTRNRTDDLQRCLEALGRLRDDGQELIVVDNCPSSDSTRRLVEDYRNIRYIIEKRPGLDIARNRALREAKYDIVAFTDDDAAPDPEWLRSLIRNFEDPLVLCVTGLTMPIELETRAQEFFQRAGGLGRGFKRTVYDSAYDDPFEGWQAGAGVNMALRRSILENIGPFDEALDVGTPVRGGGDSDIFRRILAAGYRIVYDPDALNWHRHRRDWEGLRRQVNGYESAGFAVWTRSLLMEGELEALTQSRNWLRRELPALVRSLLRQPGSGPPDLAIARLMGAVAGPWAYLYACWKLRKEKRAL